MSVETVLVARAAAYSALTALIGSPPRLYYEELPQSPTLPAVRYGRVSSTRPSCMGADPGLVRARFQYDVYAATQKEARVALEALRACYQRWSNSVGTVVQDIYVVSDIDLGLDPDTRDFHSAIDFEVIYLE